MVEGHILPEQHGQGKIKESVCNIRPKATENKPRLFRIYVSFPVSAEAVVEAQRQVSLQVFLHYFFSLFPGTLTWSGRLFHCGSLCNPTDELQKLAWNLLIQCPADMYCRPSCASTYASWHSRTTMQSCCLLAMASVVWSTTKRDQPRRAIEKTKRNNFNRSNHWEKAFRVVMIVLLQSFTEELNKSGRLKVKRPALLGCESVSSRILRKPEGSGVTLVECHFNNF